MKQKVIHCSDVESQNENLITAGFFYEKMNGEQIPYLPVHDLGLIREKENESLICVLLTDEQEPQVDSVKDLSVLGTYDEIFADSAKLQIYDSIYDRSEQAIIDPETGEEATYTPPDKFAEFALPAPDPQAEYEAANKYRVKMLYETDWIAQRQLEQDESGVPPKLPEQDFTEVMIWRQSLRDLFNRRTYSTSIQWPPLPAYLVPKFPDYPRL